MLFDIIVSILKIKGHPNFGLIKLDITQLPLFENVQSA